MKKADTDGYYITATTIEDQTTTMSCGIANKHVYIVMSVFEINQNGKSNKMLLLRNPWGVTFYNGDWNSNDDRWNNENVAQVPFGIDPRTSDDENGIFVMPIEGIINGECIS